MKAAAIGLVGALILAGAPSAQKASGFTVRNGETFTGKITDSLCTTGHLIDGIKSERNCVLTCVKFEGAQFVLYNSETKRVYNMDDQLQPEPFAGQEVTVTGTYDKEANAIHVTKIRPKIFYAGL
jgi:hypothetical protein